MNGARRKVVLTVGLVLVLSLTLLWFLREPKGPAREISPPPEPSARPVLDEAHQLTVEVFSHGVAVPDAGVLVQHARFPEVFSSLKSDAKGRVVFPKLPPGEYRVTAMRFGYEQGSKVIRLSGPTHKLRLGLARSSAEPVPSATAKPSAEANPRLSGRVVDERGEPVPKAQVGASSSAHPVFVEADEQGHFELSNLGAEFVNVFASSPGFASTQLPRVAAGSEDLVIVLKNPGSLRGDLVFASTPEKLFVRLCQKDPEREKELCIKSAYSSPPSDTYELERLPPGSFDLVFSDGERELGRLPIKIDSGVQLVVPTQHL